MLCEVGKVDDRLTGVVPYPTFLTISGFQAATLAALSASNGWAAETVLLAEPFSPLSESQWISCLSSWLRHQLDRIEPEMLCHTEKKVDGTAASGLVAKEVRARVAPERSPACRLRR